MGRFLPLLLLLLTEPGVSGFLDSFMLLCLALILL